MSRTIRLSVFTVICMFIAVSTVSAEDFKRVKPENISLSTERLERMGNAMQRAIEDGQLAGTLCMVVRQGKVAYLETNGMMDREKSIPMPEDAIFRICSMTKPITSVAVMMLYEEGHFLLTDQVSKYIPEFKEMTVLKKTDSGKTYTVPAEKQITIRHLLTHSSGLTYHWDKDLGHLYNDAGITHGLISDPKTIGEGVKKLAAIPLLFEPGERYKYGLSIDVLGYFVEVISGMTLDEFFRTRIFEPLGMVDTHFYLPEEKLSRLVTVYIHDNDKGLERMPDETLSYNGLAYRYDYPYTGTKSYFSGGGGLSSTAHDYARFCQMLLNEGELDGVRLLGTKTVRFIRSPHQPLNAEMDFGLGFAVRGVNKPLQNLTSPGRYGWSGFYNTLFFIDPEEEMFGIFMSQLCPGSGLTLSQRFEVLVYQAIIE